MRSYQTIQEMTMELFDGYNSGKKVLTDAELPEYLKKLQTAVSQMFSRDSKAAKQSGILQKTEKMVSKVKTPELEAAYMDVLDAVAEGKEAAIKKALWVATQEKSRYYAKRIARTEASRSYNEGFKAEAMSDPDVGGLQLKLNTSHPKPDICDEVASTDVGYGPGIFPKDQAPDLPLHPNCMCRWRKIWVWRMKPTGGKDQLPKLWKQGPNRVEEALKEADYTESAIVKQNGLNNSYTVNYDVVNRKAYHDKYMTLTSHSAVNESLYREGMAILQHRNGTEYEDLTVIDCRTGRLLTKNDIAAGVFKFRTGLSAERKYVE